MTRREMLSGVLLAAAAPRGARSADSRELQTTQLRLVYDERQHLALRWMGAPESILAFDPAVQDSIEVNGWRVSDFGPADPARAPQRTEDARFGPGNELVLSGVYRHLDREIRIRRNLRAFVPDRLPNAVVFQKSYVNEGKRPVHIGNIYTQRYLLDRKLADSAEPSHAFASFQGGAYKWARDYALIPLEPGFRQTNFQGLDDRTGPEGEGGGMPFIDIWSPEMGIAVAHIENKPQWVSLPVEVRSDGKIDIGLTEQPSAKFGQNEWLRPGDTYRCVESAVICHKGDFYDALSAYGELLRAQGVPIPRTSPAIAREPYWKTWGFELDFTQERIFNLLPELKSMGIHIANLDDGWFDRYGDWQPNRAAGKFPAGDADVKSFVKRLHDEGFKSSVWWYPIGASPDSRLAREHPDLLVQDANGRFPVDDRGVHQLCPGYVPALDEIERTMRRFLLDYNFDGVYIDSTGLTAVPPCYNPAHKHASPLDSFQATPRMFERVYTVLRKLKGPEAPIEACVCGLPHSPYYMPYYALAGASDPTSPLQMRRRIKLEKAIRGPRFAVSDCYEVPIQEWKGSSVPESFESGIGTGAQLATFYTSLTGEQREKWRKWFALYRELGLSGAEYLNLYDLAFDKPEVHVVRKDGDLYYGVYADFWSLNRRIELRGLDPAKTYEVYDYANGREFGTVTGKQPFIKAAFRDSLLLRVQPQAKERK